MRALLTFAAILFLPATTLGSAQARPVEKEPQKGDRIIVRGCLSGPVLESTEMSIADRDGMLASGVTFRLTGDKDLLKQMRKEDDGRIVEVTGVLKSDLPRTDTKRGKRIGNTRIVVGVGRPQTMREQGPPHMPVLQVKSYEPRMISCGG